MIVFTGLFCFWAKIQKNIGSKWYFFLVKFKNIILSELKRKKKIEK